jgi:hypothetical protein
MLIFQKNPSAFIALTGALIFCAQCRITYQECGFFDSTCNPLRADLIYRTMSSATHCGQRPPGNWNTFAGSPIGDTANAIYQTADCNFLVAGDAAGAFSSGTALNSFPGTQSAIIQKLAYNGQAQWHVYFGQGNTYSARAIVEASDGSLFLFGTANAGFGSPLLPFTGGTTNLFLARFSSTGSLLWHLYLADASAAALSAFDLIAQDNDAIITGNSRQAVQNIGTPVTGHPGGTVNSGFIAKFNSDGNVIWHTYAGAGGTTQTSPSKITLLSDGSYGIAGNAAANFGSPIIAHTVGVTNDIFAARFSSTGSLSWVSFFGENSNIESASGIAQLNSGNIVVLGTTGSAPLPTVTYGLPLQPYSVAEDFLILKLNMDGALQNYTYFGGAGSQFASSIARSQSGGCVALGRSDMDIAGTLNPHSGAFDFLALALDENLNRKWHTFRGSTNSDFSAAIIESAEGGYALTGSAGGSFGSPLNPYTSAGTDFAIARLTPDGL